MRLKSQCHSDWWRNCQWYKVLLIINKKKQCLVSATFQFVLLVRFQLCEWDWKIIILLQKILISSSCGICQLLITTIINCLPCKKSHETKFTKFLLSGQFIQKGLRATWLSILSFKCFCVCVCSLKIFQWPEVSYSHLVFKRKETSVELN